jgi:hypothetical protein
MAKFNKNPGGGDNNGKPPTHITRPSRHMIMEPRCNVCKSPHRKVIDMLLTAGAPFTEVEREFEAEGLSRKSLSNHKSRHLNVEQAAIRRIIEDQARTEMDNIENTRRTLLTRKAVLQIMMSKGYQDVILERVQVEPRDIINIVQQLDKMDEKTAAMELEETMRHFVLFQQAVKDTVPDSMWDALAARFMDLKQSQTNVIEVYGVEVMEDGVTPRPLLEPPDPFTDEDVDAQ